MDFIQFIFPVGGLVIGVFLIFVPFLIHEQLKKNGAKQDETNRLLAVLCKNTSPPAVHKTPVAPQQRVPGRVI